jgi:flagellar P-ring protein precursor FlgI
MNKERTVMRILTVLLIATSMLLPRAHAASVRIKDIADVGGVRENQLVGIGLVTGLSGTGDKSGTAFTDQAVENLIKRYGLSLPTGTASTKNNALVLVTATLPPFVKQGSKIDVTVSAIGDAKSLQGGTLALTELKGIDFETYALVQGAVSVGGFDEGRAGPGGSRVKKAVPTVGRIPSAAIIEKEVPSDIVQGGVISINLRKGDFTTAARMSESINKRFRGISYPLDPSTVVIEVPTEYSNARKTVEFVSEIENLTLTPAQKAVVVINERTGTIIAGGRDVAVTACHITHGAIMLTIESTPDVSQPLPFSQGVTAFLSKVFTDVKDKPGSTLDLKEGATAGEVAQLLTEMKVSPNDIISIFQMLKESGNLQADLRIQ